MADIMMNKLLLAALFVSANVMAANVMSQEVECPSAEGHVLGYQYAVKSTTGNDQKISFQPIAVAGDQKHTWVRFPHGVQWAVPYVPTSTEGTDLFLTWDDDGTCMKVAIGAGQDFYLGYQGKSMLVQWVGGK